MNCPRPGEQCSEFMCGSSVDGICTSDTEGKDIHLSDYNILIDPTEFQKKVLDYISSDEFENMVNSTVFKDNDNCKHAIAHGMVIAAMLTSRCVSYIVKEKLES